MGEFAAATVVAAEAAPTAAVDWCWMTSLDGCCCCSCCFAKYPMSRSVNQYTSGHTNSNTGKKLHSSVRMARSNDEDSPSHTTAATVDENDVDSEGVPCCCCCCCCCNTHSWTYRASASLRAASSCCVAVADVGIIGFAFLVVDFVVVAVVPVDDGYGYPPRCNVPVERAHKAAGSVDFTQRESWPVVVVVVVVLIGSFPAGWSTSASPALLLRQCRFAVSSSSCCCRCCCCNCCSCRR